MARPKRFWTCAVHRAAERVLLVVAHVVGDVVGRRLLDLDGDRGHRVRGGGDHRPPEDPEVAQAALGVGELARVEGLAFLELRELRAHEALARAPEAADLHGTDRLGDPLLDVEDDLEVGSVLLEARD